MIAGVQRVRMRRQPGATQQTLQRGFSTGAILRSSDISVPIDEYVVRETVYPKTCGEVCAVVEYDPA